MHHLVTISGRRYACVVKSILSCFIMHKRLPLALGLASPTWNSLPSRPLDCPMIANGLLGTYLLQDPDSGEIRFEINREDLFDVRLNFAAHKTNGYLMTEGIV